MRSIELRRLVYSVLKADCVPLRNYKIPMENATAAVIEGHTRYVPKNKPTALETYKQSYRYGVGLFINCLHYVCHRSLNVLLKKPNYYT